MLCNQDGSLIHVNGHWDTLCVHLYTHIIILFSLLVPQQRKWHGPPQTGKPESGRGGGQEEGERRNKGRECEREWVGRRTGKEESGVLWCYWEGGGPGAGEAVRRDGGGQTVGAPFSSPLLLRVFSCPWCFRRSSVCDLPQYSLYLFLPDMFWIQGSSAGVRNEEICYGRYMSFPTRYTPGLFRGQLYFTPSDGGPRKLLMDNGEVSSFATTSLHSNDAQVDP